MICVALLLAVLVMSVSAFNAQAGSRLIQTKRELVMRERACDITGARRNKANNVSKSNAHTIRFQHVNLQSRKLWWEEGNKFVKLRVSTRTLKTITKNGLNATAKKYGINLNQFAISSGDGPWKPDASIKEV